MNNWHPDPSLLASYVDGGTDQMLAASVESHLMACSSCRTRLAPSVDPIRLDAIWAEVTDKVDAPRVGLIEGLLHRFGLSPDTTRLLIATPSLRAPWLLAVAMALVFAALAADSEGRHVLVFLALAPLAPVAGVALAFSRPSDPAREIGMAAPYSAVRLLMIRAAAVLLTTVIAASAASLVFPDEVGFTAAWLLPALALTGLTLALSGRLEPAFGATAVALGWLAVVVGSRAEFSDFALFGGTGQVVFAILAIASAVEVWRSRDRFNQLRGPAA